MVGISAGTLDQKEVNFVTTLNIKDGIFPISPVKVESFPAQI